jgi:hypothetical protein
MVSFLKGHAPDLTEVHHAEEFGRIVGEITSALGKYADADGSLTYYGIPFSNIYSIHPLADIPSVKSFFEEPPFHIPVGDVSFYSEMILSVENENSFDLLEKLPKQLVHHDLLVFNLVAHENKIKGVLDSFNFLKRFSGFRESCFMQVPPAVDSDERGNSATETYDGRMIGKKYMLEIANLLVSGRTACMGRGG